MKLDKQVQYIIRWFHTRPEGKVCWTYLIWAGLLFVSGAFLLGFFQNWGRGPLEYHDWSVITTPRLGFLQNAVRQGALPLHVANTRMLGDFTDRFLGITDTLFSPQVLLLLWMDVGTFAMANVFLLYTAGFVGLLWFARGQRLSPLAFTILFFLFNFNGHLLAHFSVGHNTWSSYFLYSWLLVFVFALFDAPLGWGWVAGFSTWMFVLVLQGGYHQFVYALFLLALLALTFPHHFKMLTYTAVFSVLVNAVRIIPTALNMDSFNQKIGYFAGYPSFYHILLAMIDPIMPGDLTNSLGITSPIGAWEYNLYTGLPGALFLFLFGAVMALRNREKASSNAALLLPVFALAVLSLDRVYKYLRIVVPLPLITGERAPSRIIELALVLFLALAVVEFQRWCDSRRPSMLFLSGSVVALAALGHDLWQNIRLWRVVEAAEHFETIPLNPAQWTVANHADPAYLAALWVGTAITLLSFGLLWFLRHRQTRHNYLLDIKSPGRTGAQK